MELTGQILTFIMTIATGILLGVLFDGYRVLRNTFTPQNFVTWCTDLLYWLVATVVVFISLVLSNWGELRFYVFIGIIGGLTLYYQWVSHWAVRLLARGIQFMMKAIHILKKIIIAVVLRPGIYCTRMISWPFMFLWHRGIMMCRRWYKKNMDDEKK